MAVCRHPIKQNPLPLSIFWWTHPPSLCGLIGWSLYKASFCICTDIHTQRLAIHSHTWKFPFGTGVVCHWPKFSNMHLLSWPWKNIVLYCNKTSTDIPPPVDTKEHKSIQECWKIMPTKTQFNLPLNDTSKAPVEMRVFSTALQMKNRIMQA